MKKAFSINVLIINLIYLFINVIFIYKYGTRQNYIPITILIFVYLLVFLILSVENRITERFIYYLKKIKFIIFCCFFSILFLFIIYHTDGNSLNTDRWSAMHVGIKALIHGEYPYTAIDHLGGRTSNFPGLLLIGLPFYLLGNVGYLQVFSFILLGYTLDKTQNINFNYKFILFLLFSPAFWWEIFGLSDLLSNLIIIFCYILLSQKNFTFNKPIKLGLINSFLILTRGIVAIPLTLFLFRPFLKTNYRNKLYFTITFLISTFFLILIVLKNCPNYYTLLHFNPLILQTSTLPNYVILLSLVVPLGASFLIKKFYYDFFYFSTLLLFIPIFIGFYITFLNFGIKETLLESKFDITYFTITLPFLIFYLVKNESKKVN